MHTLEEVVGKESLKVFFKDCLYEAKIKLVLFEKTDKIMNKINLQLFHISIYRIK